MKKAVLVFIVAGLLITIVSCNNPLNKKYSEANLAVDIDEIYESKKADSTDILYMGMYLVRAKMGGEKLEDKTYGDILNSAKELRKQKEKEDAELKQ